MLKCLYKIPLKVLMQVAITIIICPFKIISVNKIIYRGQIVIMSIRFGVNYSHTRNNSPVLNYAYIID